MKDRRVGESLWEEWEESEELGVICFITLDHVSLENEIVRRALASSLQRDGIADSLKDGFSFIEDSKTWFGWSGFLEGDSHLTACDKNGETDLGDFVEKIFPTTWVQINL